MTTDADTDVRLIRVKIARVEELPSPEDFYVFDLFVDGADKPYGNIESFGFQHVCNRIIGFTHEHHIRFTPPDTIVHHEFVLRDGKRIQRSYGSRLSGEFCAQVGQQFKFYVDDEYTYKVIEANRLM